MKLPSVPALGHTPHVHDALVQLLGPEKVSTAGEVLATHATDRWHASARPDAVVFAESTDDIVRTLTFAHERKIPVTTRGARSASST